MKTYRCDCEIKPETVLTLFFFLILSLKFCLNLGVGIALNLPQSLVTPKEHQKVKI